MIFTTSWDDGYASDLRIAELLERHGTTGTFYVCPATQHGERMLSKEEIRSLSGRFEVGAHTLTHPRLTTLPTKQAMKELHESKGWLERITGKPCTSFCYPKGAHDERICKLTQEAGFVCARTTDMFRFTANDRFALPVSIQVMPFPFRRSFRPPWKYLDPLGPLRAHYPRLRKLGIGLRSCGNWLNLAKALFTHALETSQPFFHLYGHAREMERYGQWEELEQFLTFVSDTPGLTHKTNTELARTVI
ncbi:MAG: polysaccharide deacetylase family protein [Candidatus Peribacteraceae bacterium]|nr:polysaccharide deacetylase family protein [Candidatus Peribacteraceae bacterium]